MITKKKRNINPNHNRTLCEVLREIGDITDDEVIIKKLAEATWMAKRMATKLSDYKKGWEKKFYEKNPNDIKFSDKDIYKD